MRRWRFGLAFGILLAMTLSGCGTSTPTPTHKPVSTSTPTGTLSVRYVCNTSGVGVMLRSDAACQVKTSSGLSDGTAVFTYGETVGGCTVVKMLNDARGYIPTRYLCNDGARPTPTTSGPTRPPGWVDWSQTKNYVGQTRWVCGTVKGTSYRPDVNSQPTWLNIGENYPSPKRMQVTIWGKYRKNFPQPPETYYDQQTVCVTGLIELQSGVAQIEITGPSAVLMGVR